GVTGAPGSGKSTLVDRLAHHYRQAAETVGIIAVDPTSPFTGGAILGDRIRMQSRSLDPGTFIRSMATRGNLGGLSRATADAVAVLDAAGFDLVLIETVGVGQDEVEIAQTAAVTLVLLVPGMGDDVQAMKAGILEIADIFVINKSDRSGVDRVEAELEALIAIGNRADGWKPRVVRTVATDDTGTEACAAAIAEFRRFAQGSEGRRDRQIRIQKERLLDLVRGRVTGDLLRDREAAGRLDRLAAQVVDRAVDPYTAADELLSAFFSLSGRARG
ncbi:MAG: methylmalonyl Co-A mutase-associated GTPase MeaB, partial [Acidobacteria bacterium]|nr:methylmalonyl Co-A mutase-associated GTPase MeaB [Acidobacteriota bacterium]